MNKIKSISKRTLALILSMLMLLSSGIVGTLAANVELAETGATISSTGTSRLYFNMSAISWWTAGTNGNGNFAYFFNNSTNQNAWSAHAVQYSGSTYYVTIPSGDWSGVILTRNNTSTSPSWDNKWNQTGDITLSSTSNYISSFSEGSTTVTWGTAIKPASTASLSASANTVAPGTGVTLTPSLTSNQTLNTIKSTTYSISPSSGASISGNTFTATTAGTYTVTATVTYYPNGYSSITSTATATTTITVTDPKYTYTVTAGAGGTVSPENGSVNKGESVDIVATPSTGYSFEKWTATNGTVGSTTSASTTFTPSANGANAHATFTPNSYTITYLNDDDTVLGTGTAKYDSLVSDALSSAPAATKDATAEFEYAFKEWVHEDGTAIGANEYISGDVTLKATYTETIRSYTVNYSGENGTVSVAYADGSVVPSGSKVPYGTVLTLTATPNKFYNVGTWTASTGSVSDNTYTVTGDVTLTHTFAAKTTYEITVVPNRDCVITYTCDGYDFESLINDTYKAEAGAEITFEIEAPLGYYIYTVGDYTNADKDYSVTSYKLNVIADSDKDFEVIFDVLPTYNVTVSANDSTMGTVTGANDAVIYGNKVNLTATANEGYRFVNWTVEGTYSDVGFGDTLPVTSLVPQSDLTITANFVANKGTVNISATEGGTVDKDGTHNLTYPETITATATATESGYQFTHWTINSTGTKGTDYAVTEQGNKITVQILTDGTEVSVIANFANAQKVKVYTYSDNGFTSLKVTESDGSETLIPFNGSQNPITFGDNTWYTPGELTLTAGYNDAITAQMYGSSPLENGTGTLVMFNNNLGWDNVYLYTSSTAQMWNTDTSDCNTKGLTAVQMQRIGTTNHYYAYVSGTVKYTLFLEKENNNYDRVNNNNAVYRGDFSSSNPMFTPTSGQTATNTNATNYYNAGSWGAQPTIATTTNAVDITSVLYNGDEWLGNEEVWLYFAANGTTVVATNRRQLNDYVTSALIKGAYNNGKNDKGYTDTSWNNFVAAYKAAVSTLGTGASTQAQIDSAYTTLETAYKALELTSTVTISGSHGAMPNFGTYFGTISFPGLSVTSKTGNIGDSGSNGESPNCTYLSATVDRNQVITINTTVKDSDYMVLGWVINGTEFIPATQDIDNSDLFVGTYTCSNNAVIVPIYFRDDTIAKYNSANEDESSQVIKLYAKTDDSSSTWGNYMAAYTWYSSSYRQFGRWTGQLMIPDTANPGMYYTYVEKVNPNDSSDAVDGITFNNYGNNTGIYTGDRYQAYDYYEFVSLAEQGYDNIVFELNESDGVSNWPSKSTIDLSNNVYNFYPFVDFSGNEIDISRTILTDEQKALDPALYIVRTGPCDADDSEVGKPTGSVIDGEYFINCYIYNASTGAYIGSCKSYELLDLEALKTGSRKLDLTSYIGKPVAVDYASLTDTSGNKRYDGEWFGTKYGFTTVDISVQVAYLNTNGTVTYFADKDTPNYVDTVGSAYVNGEASVEVDHGSEGHIINATTLNGNDFVGWYRATANADGTYTIDASAAPLFAERSTTIDASADAVYIALFKEHPEGTFTVNNYYYTYSDFSGQTISPYAPPVFGGDTSYSVRDVMLKKVYDDQTGVVENPTAQRAGTYSQSLEEISPGDKIEITIYTNPTYKRDYVYAWYIQANDSYGVNFEEIGTNELKDSVDPGVEKSFTFTYTVKEGTSSLTIYSDVVHITPEVTLTYIYNNRYNQEQRYVVKYTLTNDELNDYKPDIDKIRELAPYVDDLYKKVNWVIEDYDNDISVAGTSYNVRAVENGTFTVNLVANGLPADEPITVPFNTPIDIYAKDINEECTDRGGVWFLDEDGDGNYDEGTDKLLNYGNYFGLVVTDDMTVSYTDNQELIYQIILGDPIYGREQSTDANGGNAIDTIYVDYILSYMIPHFTGDKIDVNGTEDTSDDVTLKDDVNYNTPVQIKTLEAAGLQVDYGVVLEMVNTQGPADTRNNYYKDYYDVEAMTDATKAKLDAILKNKADGADASGKGVEDGSTLATFLYVYASENATNKNRVLKTFAFDNTPANQMKYYNVYGYLKITDKKGNVEIIYSNPQTLNILDESIGNAAQN